MTIIKSITSLNLKSNKSVSQINNSNVSGEMSKNGNSGLILAIVGGTLGLFGGLLAGLGAGAADGIKEGFTTAVTSLIQNPTSILTP